MKIAYAYWNGRIAPVFDSAHHVHIVESEGEQIISEQQHALPDEGPFQKAAHLIELGVQTLVCGAISRPLHEWLLTRNVNVIAFVAGELREVRKARTEGTLEGSAFAMPGCGRRHMRGMGAGKGRGFGSEAGRGMGQGMGRGMGVGAGSGMGGMGRGMRFGTGAGYGAGRGMGRGRNNQG